MNPRTAILVGTAVLAAAGATGAPAQAAGPECEKGDRGQCAEASAGTDDFTVGIVEEQEAAPQGPRPRGVKQPLSPTYVDRNFVPTCTGNTAFDGGTLCNAAVQTCPEGQVRFWVFEATIVRATGRPAPGEGYRMVDTVCRGPNEPELDPAVAIPALVQREFKSVVVLSGNAQVSPAPETLVNVPTRFQTDAPASYEIPLTLLNRRVVITARAQRYIWQVGEGNRRVSTRPKGYLEYSYKKSGPREVYVDIEWSGTFRIGDGPEQPITGTVVTEGEPVDVQVRQARSELVRD